MRFQSAVPRAAIGRALAGRLPLLLAGALLLVATTAMVRAGSESAATQRTRANGGSMLKEITFCVALFGSTAGCSAAAGVADDAPGATGFVSEAPAVIDGSGLPSEVERPGDVPLADGLERLPRSDQSRQPPSSTASETNETACEGFSVGDVLFASGEAELTEAGRAAIAQLAELLPSAARLAIEGHTDDKPIAIGNQRLSEMRAATVADALEEVVGDGGTIVRVQGWGETQPIADNATPEGRALNRRVEILVNC